MILVLKGIQYISCLFWENLLEMQHFPSPTSPKPTGNTYYIHSSSKVSHFNLNNVRNHFWLSLHATLCPNIDLLGKNNNSANAEGR